MVLKTMEKTPVWSVKRHRGVDVAVCDHVSVTNGQQILTNVIFTHTWDGANFSNMFIQSPSMGTCLLRKGVV